MVDYNKQRREAMVLIETFAKKGKFTTEDIAFHVSRSTGFSEKFTHEYIGKCISRQFFFKNKDDVISAKAEGDDK